EPRVLRAGTVGMPGALPLPCDILLERDVPMQLRDGTTIYVDIFRPVDDEPHPAIVAVSPYGKEIGGHWLDDSRNRAGVPMGAVSGLMKFEGPDPAFWVENGYAIVNTDDRGAFNSEGVIMFYGAPVGRDGADVVDWVGTRDWCNGRVGLAGNSWLAIAQWFIAAEKPEHLAAIAPWEGLSDVAREDVLRGGIPRAEFMQRVADNFASTPEGGIEDVVGCMFERPTMDAYWKDKAADLEAIDVPAYVVASWTNMIHTHGTLEGWKRISSPEKWLRIHNTQDWRVVYGPTRSGELLRFFDRYLKGEENGWEETPRIRMSVLNPGGQDEVNRVEEDYPLARAAYRPLYLGADGTLADAPSCAPAELVYDADEKGAKLVWDYTIPADCEIVGPLSLRLWVEARGSNDMDLAVSVEKLGAEGEPLACADGPTPKMRGAQRVSMRELDEARSTEGHPYLTLANEQLLSPGEIVPVEILVWPVAMRCSAGEKLRLALNAHKTGSGRSKPGGDGTNPVYIPKEGFTFEPDSEPELLALCGDATETSIPDVIDDIPRDRNAGLHVVHMGGDYDSALLVPFVEI
ncbi:MAG: CocE/NonD family hydrolase, partial [Atopobiaceae bacterium]|nr:CocE/NonD family hydrolase [Atopobiaceae bacterium]